MKSILLKYLPLVTIIAALFGCQKNTGSYSAGNGVNFYYTNTGDTLVNYSFVYGSPTATVDTVWLKVVTMGNLTDNDREISLEQVMVTKANHDAVAGTDYVAFNDASLKKYYIMPAGKSTTSIPVILKRNAALQTKVDTLLIRIKTNNEFTAIDLSRNTVKVVFSAQLLKPSRWAYYCSAYFGTYGPVKHQWLIDNTGNKWDDPYLGDVLGFTSGLVYGATGTNENYDGGYNTYISDALTIKLAAYNAARVAQGLGVLKEADGTVVAF